MNEGNDMDDIFDEDATEMMIGSRDWMKTESGLANKGFRDGISSGQEVRLQEGFNSGYRTAASVVFVVAKLRGEISATLTLHHLGKVPPDMDKEKALEHLVQEASDLEKQCLKGGSVAKQHVDAFCCQAAEKTDNSFGVLKESRREGEITPQSVLTTKEKIIPSSEPRESCDSSDKEICDSRENLKDKSDSCEESLCLSNYIHDDKKDKKYSESQQSEMEDLLTKVEHIKEKLKAILCG